MYGTLCSKCGFATFQCKHVKMGDYIQFVLNVKFHRYRVVILPEYYHLSLSANTLPHAWADR
jgi:predicted nucleic-acid-binding Zn-ribbon protein